MAKAPRMSEEELKKFQSRLATKPTAIDNYVLDTLGGADVKPPKPRKYQNVPTIVDGIKFDSKREAAWFSGLRLMEKADKIRNLQRSVAFPLMVDGIVVQRYRCDFWYWEQTGAQSPKWRLVVADVKSEGTSRVRDWPRTKKLFEACYGMPITELS